MAGLERLDRLGDPAEAELEQAEPGVQVDVVGKLEAARKVAAAVGFVAEAGLDQNQRGERLRQQRELACVLGQLGRLRRAGQRGRPAATAQVEVRLHRERVDERADGAGRTGGAQHA